MFLIDIYYLKICSSFFNRIDKISKKHRRRKVNRNVLNIESRWKVTPTRLKLNIPVYLRKEDINVLNL